MSHPERMRAVIPAGGFGTRILPATKSMPKEMLTVVDRPAIQHVVEEAAASGFEEVVVVTGRSKRAIEDHFDASPDLEGFLAEKGKKELLEIVKRASQLAKIFYVRQDWPRGLGHAILQAGPLVRGNAFGVLLGDDIIAHGKPAMRQLRDAYERTGRSVFCVQRVPMDQVSRYGVVKVEPVKGGLHRVIDIIEKPRREDAPSDLVTIGRYIFTPRILDHLAATKPGVGGEIQLTDAIRALLEHEDVYCLQFEGERHDVGSVEGWLETNIRLAYENPVYRAAMEQAFADLRKKRG